MSVRFVMDLFDVIDNLAVIVSVSGMVRRLKRLATVTDGTVTYKIYRDHDIVYALDDTAEYPVLLVYEVSPEMSDNEIVKAIVGGMVKEGMLYEDTLEVDYD